MTIVVNSRDYVKGLKYIIPLNLGMWLTWRELYNNV